MDKQKILVGMLVLVIFSTGIYITLEEFGVRMRIDHDKSSFYVPHEDYSWIWTVSGREYNRLFDGTSIMYRDTNSINIEREIDGQDVWIYRTTEYQRGPVIKDTYHFRGDVKSEDKFPISHTVEIFNASGKFYRYTVDDLTGTGPKRKSTETEFYFGKNMKVEVEDDSRWTWIGWPYGSDSISAQYDIDSDYEKFEVRLLDPICNCQNCSDCTDKLNSGACTVANLTQNVNTGSNCINNPSNFTSKTLECNDYLINNTGSSSNDGIMLNSKNNNTIQNCKFGNFDYAIDLDTSHNTTLINNTLSDNARGIDLEDSDDCVISNNTASNNSEYGIYLDTGTNRADIQDNILKNNSYYDLYITNTCDHTISSNTGSTGDAIYYSDSSVTLEDSDDEYTQIILCEADNSVINNVTIDNSGTNNNGILIIKNDVGAGKTNITNNNLYDTYIGINTYRSGDTDILNNTVLGSSGGKTIYLDEYRANVKNANYDTVDNNYVTGGTISITNDGGFDSTDLWDEVVTNNEVYNATGNGISLGNNIHNFTISNNIVDNTTADCIYSREFLDGNANITHNNVSNCGEKGIQLGSYTLATNNLVNISHNAGIDSELGNNNITNNEVYNTSISYGIVGDTSDYITNNFIKDTYGGIYTGSSNVVKNNTINETGQSGIRADDNCNVSNNKIFNCTYHGIYIYDNGNRIWSNDISYGTNAGGNSIEIGSSAHNNDIFSNNMTYSPDDGMEITGNNNNITNNNIKFSTGKGISVTGDDNDISNNTIANNTESGVSIYWDDGSSVYSNNITNNQKGVLIDESAENTILDNIIQDNTEGIVLEDDADNNNFSRNTIIDNNVGMNITQLSCDDNLIYDNNFSNTNYNAIDRGTNNNWNTSNSDEISIVGGELGGNLWDDYTSQRNLTDRTGDGIGDDNIPWSDTYSSKLIDVNDYLPLAVIRCGDRLIGDTNISSTNNLENCSGNGLTMEEDDITLDCKSIEIENATGSMIYLNQTDGNNIENCKISDSDTGIYIDSSSNYTITGNILIDNDIGINVSSGSNDGLTYYNYFGNNGDNNAYDPEANNNDWNNSVVGNYWSNYLSANFTDDDDYNVSYKNGIPINSENSPNPSNIDYLPHTLDQWGTLFDCNRWITSESSNSVVTLNNNILCEEENGINIDSSSDITNVTIDCQGHSITGDGTSRGISYLGNSGTGEARFQNSIIKNCTISNFSEGISLIADAYAVVRWRLLCFHYEGYNEPKNITIENNTITNSNKGIYFKAYESTDWSGLCVDEAQNADVYDNTVKGNIISNNDYGIYLDAKDKMGSEGDGEDYCAVRDNTFHTNRIIDNDVGVHHTYSTFPNSHDSGKAPIRNNLYYNNEFDNTDDVDEYDSLNMWNTTYNASGTSILGAGYVIGGNIWTNYNGTDNGSGASYPYNISGDGIGDTEVPYNVSIEPGTSDLDQDYLPLDEPDYVSTNITLGEGISSISWRVPFYTGTTAYNVSPENQTDSIGLFRAYNNGTVAGNIRMKYNDTYPNVTTECSNSSDYSTSIVLNTTYQIVESNVEGKSNELVRIWCKRNYTDVPDPKKNLKWEFNITQ